MPTLAECLGKSILPKPYKERLVQIQERHALKHGADRGGRMAIDELFGEVDAELRQMVGQLDVDFPETTATPVAAPTPVAETITGQVNERIGSEGLTGGNPRRDPMPAERQGRPTPASAAGSKRLDRPWDLIDQVESNVGKINLRLILEANPDFKPRGAARRIFTKTGGTAADVAADAMARDGLYKGDPGMVDQFAEALNEAALGRQGNRKMGSEQRKAAIEEGRQLAQFEQKVLQGQRPKKEAGNVERVGVDNLVAGDVFKVQDQEFTVERLEWDPETGELAGVVVKDGPKFGVQRIDRDNAEVIHVDRGTYKPAEVSTDFLPPEEAPVRPLTVEQAFNLRDSQSPKSSLTAREAAEKAKRDRRTRKGLERIAEIGWMRGSETDFGPGFLDEMVRLGAMDMAWDAQGDPFYALKGTALPENLTQRLDANEMPVFDKGADFSLESVTTEQLKAEEAARNKAAAEQAQREEIARRQAAPLSGDSSDVGQGALFQEDANLFSGPSAERSRGSRGAEATVGQAYPGGPLGEAPAKPADNPGYSAFPMELPEAVKFARELAGGAYPKLRERLRILGGRALGVFRHNDAAGQASIEMRRDIFDLPPSERRRLREEAQKYAEAAARPGDDVAQLAARRYEFLKREAFKENPVMALKVLWHEIGHWVDWLPDHMVAGRGNLLGRLASLKDYLRHTLPEGPDVPDRPITDNEKAKMRREAEQQLRAEIESGAISEIVRTILVEDPTMKAAGITPDDVRSLFGMDAREKMPEIYRWFAEQPGEVKKEIVKAAMKGVVDSRVQAVANAKPKMREETVRMKTLGPLREPTAAEIRERFQKLFREELARRRLVQLSQIKAELEPMIAWWRGTETMEEYFRKSSEMYAEAFSIFANNPAALEKRAPTYYRVLRNYMSRKPEVAKLYREIQDSLASGTIMRDRVEDLRRSWRDDDENSLARAFNAEKTKPRAFLDNVLYHIDDRLGPVYQVARRAGALGGKLREAAGNYRYRATEHERLLARVNREVVEPLAADGIDREMLAEYMFHKHVTESRFVKDRQTGELRMIGNPMGWAPKNSLERLAEMKTQLGPEGFAKVEAAQQRFRQIYEEQVVDLVRRSGLASPELMQAIEERTFYSTFSKAKGEPAQDGIAQLIEETYGAGPGGKVYRQVGNLGEIKNPFTATVMKSLALTSAAYRNILKRQTVAAMLEHDAGNIKPADLRWTGERMEPIILGEQKGSKVGTIVLLDQGQVKAYYVPKAVAEAIEGGPVVDNLLAMTAMKGLGQFKAIFTQLNYGFWPVAFVRDAVAWQMQLPGAGPKGYLKHIGPAMKAAKESLNGRRYNKAADLALKRKMLISRADTRGLEGTVADEFDLKVASYGLDPLKWGEADNKVGSLMRIWQAYQHLGQTLERAQKIAGMTYLDENFPTMPEWQKQEMVRERAGSPDFLRKGASAPYVDWVMMFFNPWKEGVRSLAKSARENPFSFSAKTLAAVVAPTILQSLAVNGLFGDDAKELYGSVPDYDLTNYLVVPLGWVDREKKKAAYFRLPLWEPARLMHGALFQGLTDRGRGVLSFAGGQIPGLNPILGTGSMWWDYYVSGRNPYDNFRGRELLTDDQFRVGGSTAFQELMKQTWNSAGGGIIHRFQNIPLGEPEPGRLEKFLQAPVVSNSLGRWIKVSNRGVFDRDRRAAEQVLQDDALMREAVRMMVDKNLASPPETFTEAEKVLHRDPKARRYFDELRTKVKASRRSLQEQREQKLLTKEARREAFSVDKRPPN